MTDRHSRSADSGTAPLRKIARADRPGFGLVELIVALTILAVGLLGLTGVAAVAHRSLISAAAIEEGADVAAIVIDSLMLVPDPLPGERRLGRAAARWTVTTDSASVRLDVAITVTDGARAHRLDFLAVHSPR